VSDARISLSRWLSVPLPKPSARMRLFCFPYAGAGGSAYFAWTRALAHLPIEVCAVQPPGRENRLAELPYTVMEPLAAGAAAAIRESADRPYALFGHSMGALVAFEVLRRLRAVNAPLPVHVFVSAARRRTSAASSRRSTLFMAIVPFSPPSRVATAAFRRP